MRVVGVTGTIGAGKSTVLRWLEAHGACAVDADTVVSPPLQSDGDLQERLRQRFGPQVVAGGRVDRPALSRALASPGRPRRPGGHRPPGRRPGAGRPPRSRAAGAPAFVYEAIRLVESGASAVCDELWIVTVPEAVQLARLAGRGVSEAEARRRLAWQGTPAAWTAAFQDESLRLGRPRPVLVVDNGGTAEQGRAQVERLWSGI